MFISYNKEQIIDVAKGVLAKVFLAKKDKAVLIGLNGDLGSGKTTLVQEIAKSLNIKENVISPTFTIAKFYKLDKDQKWKQLVHIDAYRIEKEDELKHIGWQEILENKENIIFIEWADRIIKSIPKDSIFFDLKYEEEIRSIKLRNE